MPRINCRIWTLLALLPLVGCTADTMTKEDARAQGGFGFDGSDLCEVFGWYNDGVCDTFCADRDPDCGPVACPAVMCDLACERFERGADGCEICECADVCEPMDARGVGVCEAFFGYAFDGESCVGLSGCNCVGDECDTTYATREACEVAHTSCSSACEPDDAAAVGPCEAEIGVFWDGNQCVLRSGCNCEGPDCDEVWNRTMEECEAEHASCGGDTCDADNAAGVGACEVVLGTVWNGDECGALSGCSCEGPDCDEVIGRSVQACQAEHASCVGGGTCDADDANAVGFCLAEIGAFWTGSECVLRSGCDCEGTDCDEVIGRSLEACQAEHASCVGGGTCDAMQAEGVGACAAFWGYAWDGAQCVGLSGCNCEGPDCERTFSTPEECAQSYAMCAPTRPGCEPMDARMPSNDGPTCEVDLGVAWDGEVCRTIDCTCEGSDCDNLFSDRAACAANYAMCIPSPGCQPMDARGVGACAAFWGYAWDGGQCVGLSGCNCEGSECETTYSTREACARDHDACFAE